MAEKTNLSTNYIGMVKRGEKIPSLSTFINIANALNVSSDMILTDVIETGYTIKASLLTDKLSKLTSTERDQIYDIIETLIKHYIQNRS